MLWFGRFFPQNGSTCGCECAGWRPGNALCGCCVLWDRVAILPRLFTFRDEVASPFDSLSKKDVWGGRPSQLAIGNCAFIGCITWSFRTFPTLARIWQVGLDEVLDDVAFTEKSVLNDVAFMEKSVLYWCCFCESEYLNVSTFCLLRRETVWKSDLNCVKIRFEVRNLIWNGLKYEMRFEMVKFGKVGLNLQKRLLRNEVVFVCSCLFASMP